MKILVVRFSSIGDIVLTSPIVRCLHQLNGVEVHFLTKKPFVSLLKNNIFIEIMDILEWKSIKSQNLR